MSDKATFYKEKTQSYFNSARKEIAKLLPGQLASVLEIGCGQGDTLKWLKESYHCGNAIGIELYSDAAFIAQKQIDVVIQGDIETMELPFESNSFDLILGLDVFEHLVDPWSVMSRLSVLLKPGGFLIASIPNVKNHNVIFPLLFKDEWEYAQSGILDKTHLRFFTKKTAIKLIESGGLCVDQIISTGLGKNTKSSVANALSLGLFKALFEVQYIIRAKKI